MSIGTYLRCDSCGKHALANAPGGVHEGPSRPPGHALRAEAKAKGWRCAVDGLRSHGGGWRDFCEVCWIEAHEEREPLKDITGCDV